MHFINFNIMNSFPTITPKADKQSCADLATVKVSPVKVPMGAKQIGNYILGTPYVIQGKRSAQAPLEKCIWGYTSPQARKWQSKS